MRNFTLSLLAWSDVFGMVLNQLLERSLFRRLAGLTGQVRHMRPGRGKLTPIAVAGHDELDLLAETINAGFSQLETTRTQQESQAEAWSPRFGELEGRHQDLKKAHVRLQQFQHVSASLGSSLEITGRSGPDRGHRPRHLRGRRDLAAPVAVRISNSSPDLGAFFREKPGYAQAPPAVRMRTPGFRASPTGQPLAEGRVPGLRRHLHRFTQRPDARTSS